MLCGERVFVLENEIRKRIKRWENELRKKISVIVESWLPKKFFQK